MIEKNDCGLVVVKVTGVVRLPVPLWVVVVGILLLPAKVLVVPIQRWQRRIPLRNGNVAPPAQQ